MVAALHDCQLFDDAAFCRSAGIVNNINDNKYLAANSISFTAVKSIERPLQSQSLRLVIIGVCLSWAATFFIMSSPKTKEMKSKFKSGDIVWVEASKRLGWWPGRVENLHDLRDDLKTDVSEKTLAVVKYFNEDNYQFVENDSIIRAYDSAEKDGYITSGMSQYHLLFQLLIVT